ncbi:uncharacterized protein LOC143239435 isoform X2 [Tachypleus tridentatus]|uniref:uncharacterized protein LOC143239435 isoform X2 n=1 Tax=Tachypleus tridentatus TaxID=6853 RepID=UPI003FCF8E1C
MMMIGEEKEYPVKVAIRSRPLSIEEEQFGATCCLEFIKDKPQIIVALEKGFTFDYTFDAETTQEVIYKKCAAYLIDKVFEGYNATVLAYGQTGSGKTYTMGTDYYSNTELNETETQGIVSQALTDIFKKLKDVEESKCQVAISFLEIYNEEVYDLLSTEIQRKPVRIRESGTSVLALGLEEVEVYSIEDAICCLKQGCEARTKGATAMNANSSRSHAIFTVHLKQILGEHKRTSKLHLVDLAGSETVRKTKSQGDRFKEGVNINLGLLALGNVISNLCADGGRKQNYIPYRNSALTRILKDSLSGNSFTVMIACVSPADSNLVETIDTLRYADRARQIKNKPFINKSLIKDDLLKRKLEMIPPTPALWRQGPGFNNSVNTPVCVPTPLKRPCLNSTIQTPYQSKSSYQEQKTSFHMIPSPPSTIPLTLEGIHEKAHNSTCLEKSLVHTAPGSPVLSCSSIAPQLNITQNPDQFSPFARKLYNVLEESVSEKLEELEARLIKKLAERTTVPKDLENRILNPLNLSKETEVLRIHKEAEEARFFPSPLKDRSNVLIEESSSPFLKPKNPVSKRLPKLNSVQQKETLKDREKENSMLPFSMFTGSPELNNPEPGKRRSTRRSISTVRFCEDFQRKKNLKQRRKSTLVVFNSKPKRVDMDSEQSTNIIIASNKHLQEKHNSQVLDLLNTGSLKQLQSLPCVGPKTAQVLITWRELRGLLVSFKDLKKVHGLPTNFYHRFLKTNLLTTSP